MTMGIRNLRRDEAEDLEGLLKQHGRRIEEFELSATTAEPDSPPDVSALRGAVTIKHRESGAQKTYNTGHGTSWVAEFENDLHAGFLR